MDNVFLFTDQPVMAAGYKQALAESRFPITAVCTQLIDLVKELQAAECPLGLLEVSCLEIFPAFLEAARKVPGTAMVLLAENVPMEMVLEALASGIRGFLPRNLGPVELTQALEEIVTDAPAYRFPTISHASVSPSRRPLSGRERELIGMVCRGMKNKEIAEAMGTTVGTVKTYLNRVYKRMGVKERYELALHALAEPDQFLAV